MKKSRIGLIVALSLFYVSAYALGPSQGAIIDYYEEKPIKVQKAKWSEKDKQVRFRVRKDVEFKFTIYADDYFGLPAIRAKASIDNVTQYKVRAAYSISFHDKGGKLIGSCHGSRELASNEDGSAGSCIIYTTPESVATIATYKLRVLALEVKKKK